MLYGYQQRGPHRMQSGVATCFAWSRAAARSEALKDPRDQFPVESVDDFPC
jgi:hypothetical protein